MPEPTQPCPRLMTCLLLAISLILSAPFQAAADEAKDATKAARALAAPLEDQGFTFRADAWVNDLAPDVGKAVRVQLFKGNDYRFAIAVPPKSGVRITAVVLDFEGQPGGDLHLLDAGWGCVVDYQPSKTGVYVVAVRQTEGSSGEATQCAMITGYK